MPSIEWTGKDIETIWGTLSWFNLFQVALPAIQAFHRAALIHLQVAVFHLIQARLPHKRPFHMARVLTVGIPTD